MRFPQGFKPTPGMRLYAYQRAKLGDEVTETLIAAKIGMNPCTISNWKNELGFDKWLENQVATFRAPILDLLETIAIENLGDYRYWEAMAKKYGFIAKDGAQPLGEGAGVHMTPVELIELVKRVRAEVKGGGNSSGQVGH